MVQQATFFLSWRFNSFLILVAIAAIDVGSPAFLSGRMELFMAAGPGKFIQAQ
jgi:hypothetical protein